MINQEEEVAQEECMIEEENEALVKVAAPLPDLIAANVLLAV